MKKKLVIIGAGSMAEEITDFVEKNKLAKIVGYACSSSYVESNRIKHKNWKICSIEELSKYYKKEHVYLFIAITHFQNLNRDRKEIFLHLKKQGWKFLTLISPTAIINSKKIGEGSLIYDGAYIGQNVEIGDNVVVSNFTKVTHFCKIESHVFIATDCTIGGSVHIDEETFIGLRVLLFNDVNIGKKCIIGGGNIIKDSIPNYTMVSLKSYESNVKQLTYEEIEKKHLPPKTKIDYKLKKENKYISKDNIIDILSNNFNTIDFTKDKLIENYIIDSLDLASIVSLLQQQFDIEIPFNLINKDNFDNVDCIYNLLNNLLNLKCNYNNNNDFIGLPISKDLVELNEENSKKTVVQRIFDHAKNTPTEPAIICNDEIVTYDELSNMILIIANILTDKGVANGDRIAVQAFHNKYCVSAYYAIHLLGAILVPLEKSAAKDRMLEIADDTGAKYIISNVQDDERFINYDSLIEEINSYNKELKSFEYPSIDMPCEMVFTTGTTGKSKGVLMRHKDISWYSYALAKFINIKKHNRFFITTPLNHAGGLRRTHLSLFNGCCVVYMDGINDLGKYFEYIRKYRITALYLPPVAIRILLTRTQDELNKYKDQIDFVYSSSSSLPTGDCEKMKELLPNTRLYNAYEASETPGVSAYDYNTDNILRNCLGPANFGVELCILKEDGTMTTEANVEGQICISSKMNMKEYYNAPEISKTVWNGDWFVSNDLGYLDENKNLFYCGRKGDVINIGGYKIAPTDVEEVALKSGQLSECICIAIKDAIGIEMLELLVIPDGDSFDKKTLIDYMSSKLELYKVPRKITIVDKIEKTFNGKINRKYYRK